MENYKICDKHGKYQTQTFNFMGRIIESACPFCIDEKEREAQKHLQKSAEDFCEEKIKRGIEPEFFEASLDNYIPENDTERQALQAAKDLDEGKIKKVVLLGQNGTGKTHLAAALANKYDGVIITMFELGAQIRAGYNNGQSEIDILNKILSKQFFAIDEIGRTKGSDAEKNWMSYLLDKAHTRGVKFMLISNRAKARNLPADRKGEAFEYYFDNDILSRIQQDSVIVEVRGRDRRGSKRTR